MRLADGSSVTAPILVDAAGAWADRVAQACGVGQLGIEPKRRTMVQLRVGRAGLKDLPLVDDADGRFYFKGEGDRTVWLSPHDEIATDPCDAAPEEMDIAIAIDRFESVVDWPVEAVERSWAGLRSFAPDRLPVYGYDSRARGFFWCAGQGGFGIQTAPAAAKLAAAVLLGEEPDAMVAHIDPAIFSPARFATRPQFVLSEVRAHLERRRKTPFDYDLRRSAQDERCVVALEPVVRALAVGLGAGERVDPVVLGMAAVTLDPVPFDAVRRSGFDQLLPQIGVLDRLPVRGAPAVLPPFVDPAGDPVADVIAVGVKRDAARAA